MYTRNLSKVNVVIGDERELPERMGMVKGKRERL